MMDAALESVVVGLIALLVYARTLCRTVYVGDSGELIAAVHTLGIPHAPGYPLYVILGKIFSVLLPAGNPAIRVNFFSACSASMATGIWCLMLRRAGIPDSAATTSALAVAFGASLWSQATIARIYAPAACAISLVFYFFTRWNWNPIETKWLAAALATAGLGIAIHPIVGCALLGLIVAVTARRPELFRDVRGIVQLGWVLPGLLFYLWIPFRARSRPIVRPGHLRTYPELIRFFFRRDYWKHRYVRSVRQVGEVLTFYCYRYTKEYGLLGATATLAGIVLMSRAARPLLAMAIVTAGANAISMIAHARREDIFRWPRYMIGAWVALSLPMAFGWSWMLGFVPIQIRWLIAFVLPFMLLLKQFKRRDLSRHMLADEYSRSVLNNLPSGATLIADDDNILFPLMYLQHVLKLRPDVKLIDVAAREEAALKFHPARDAVYCTHWQAALVRPATARDVGSTLVAEGLVYRVVPLDGSYTPRNLWPDAMPRDLEDESIPRDFMTRRLLAVACIMRGEWESRLNLVAGETWWIRAAALGWDCDVVQQTVGIVLTNAGSSELAKRYFGAASRIARNEGNWRDETG